MLLRHLCDRVLNADTKDPHNINQKKQNSLTCNILTYWRMLFTAKYYNKNCLVNCNVSLRISIPIIIWLIRICGTRYVYLYCVHLQYYTVQMEINKNK